jgi:hypothetical protein
LSIVIPSARATERATIIKDKNELNLSTSMKNNRRQIPRRTITSGIRENLGFEVQGSRFRVQGSGFRVQGSRFKV